VRSNNKQRKSLLNFKQKSRVKKRTFQPLRLSVEPRAASKKSSPTAFSRSFMVKNPGQPRSSSLSTSESEEVDSSVVVRLLPLPQLPAAFTISSCLKRNGRPLNPNGNFSSPSPPSPLQRRIEANRA